MTIRPGQEQDDIHVQLNVVSLDDDPPPQFEALSYVWGDPKSTKDIKLNGWNFPVTNNLHTALRSLRRTHEARVFWIDAICVNQKDLVERGSQVSLMVRIYSECMHCTVWLGDETELTGRAFEILWWLANTDGHVSDFPDFDSDDHPHVSSRDQSVEEVLNAKGERERDGGPFEPLDSIFLAPWWSRTWTVQEFILPSTVIIKCGPFSIPRFVILKAYDCILKHMRQCCNAYWQALETASQDALLTFLNSTETLKTSGETYRETDTSLGIVSILASHRGRQCSDPRDKVYGFLGLCPDAVRQTLRADYDARLVDCYASPVIWDFEFSKSLRALGLRLGADSEGSETGLPSWIPHWSTETNGLLRQGNVFGHSELYDAANGTEALFERRGDTLLLKGHFRERIVHTGPSSMSSTNVSFFNAINSWLELWQKVYSPVQPATRDSSNCPDSTHESMKPFLRTILRDLFRPLQPVNLNHQSPGLSGGIIFRTRRATDRDYGACGRWLDLAWANGRRTDDLHLLAKGAEEKEQLEGVMDTIFYSAMYSRFFITNEMSIGLGPTTTKVGDEVWIVCGGSLPLILRREESETAMNGNLNGNGNGDDMEERHILVGTCYLDGIMDGEAAENLERDAVDVHLV